MDDVDPGYADLGAPVAVAPTTIPAIGSAVVPRSALSQIKRRRGASAADLPLILVL